jgi:hypothetical protein
MLTPPTPIPTMNLLVSFYEIPAIPKRELYKKAIEQP